MSPFYSCFRPKRTTYLTDYNSTEGSVPQFFSILAVLRNTAADVAFNVKHLALLVPNALLYAYRMPCTLVESGKLASTNHGNRSSVLYR